MATASRAGRRAPPGQPSMPSSRSHWFTTEWRGRSSRARAARCCVYIHWRPGDVVADPLRGARRQGEPGAARPAVHVNHHVVAVLRAAATPASASSSTRRSAAGPLDDDDPIEIGIAGDDCRRVALDEVGEGGVRESAPQGPDHRRREHHIADEPQPDEEDTHSSRFDGGFVQQHDGDVVLDRVDALALSSHLSAVPFLTSSTFVLHWGHARISSNSGSTGMRSPAPAVSGPFASRHRRGHYSHEDAANSPDPRAHAAHVRGASGGAAGCGRRPATRATTFSSGGATSRRVTSTRPIAAYKQALTLAPNSAELRAELAGLYARAGSRRRSGRHGRGSAEEGSGQPRGEPHPRIDLRGARRAAPEAQARRRSRVVRSDGRLRRSSGRAPRDPTRRLDLTLGRLYLQTKSYDKAIAAAAAGTARAARVDGARDDDRDRRRRRRPDRRRNRDLARGHRREPEVLSRADHAGGVEREAG